MTTMEKRARQRVRGLWPWLGVLSLLWASTAQAMPGADGTGHDGTVGDAGGDGGPALVLTDSHDNPVGNTLTGGAGGNGRGLLASDVQTSTSTTLGIDATAALAGQAGIAAGDSFDVTVNGTTTTVTIGAGETLVDIAAEMNALLGVEATATATGFNDTFQFSQDPASFRDLTLHNNNNTPLTALGVPDLTLTAPFLHGGAGGNGGNAVHLASTATGVFVNDGSLAGGAGGAGGSTSHWQGIGGDAGDGGHGLYIESGSAATFQNTGTVSGGDGGAAGTGGATGSDGLYGAGGIGVLADSNAVVINAGHITGGLSGGPAPLRNDALRFTGDDNQLVLWQGYSFTGDVVAQGSGNRLVLGGDGDSSFDVALIDDQFSGFALYEKHDLSTWTLTGVTGAAVDWTIQQGTLIGDTDSFGGDILNHGTLVFDQDAAGTFAGVLSGTGTLIKRGAGTLQLSGANSYGNTLVEAGILSGNAAAIRGDIGNAATVRFMQDSDADFAGDIAGLSGVRGAMIKAGTGVLTLFGSSTLDWTLEDGGLATAAERFGGNAQLDSGTTLHFTQTQDADYAGVLSGDGQFTKAGTGQLLLLGNSAGFSGDTRVSDGGLHVQGALGGTLTVESGASLGGTGTVGSTTLLAGAILAPGNRPGTLTVDGDLTFLDGARYEVSVEPSGTTADRVTVTGTAYLDGSVLHVGPGGVYQPFSRYTLLSAGALDGEFASVGSDFAFLTPELLYEADQVLLELIRNDIQFTSIARGRNQRAVAGAISALPTADPIYRDVLMQDDAGARAAFDGYSGDSLLAGFGSSSRLLGGFADALMRRSSGGGDPVAARLDNALHGGHSTDQPSLALDDTAQQAGVWVQAQHHDLTEQRDSGTGNAEYRFRGQTLALGMETRLPGALLGMAFGTTQGDLHLHDRQGSGDLSGWFVGTYGRWQGDGVMYVSGNISAGSTDTEQRRVVSGQLVRSDYESQGVQWALETGARLTWAETQLRPYGQISMQHLRRGRFRETGGPALQVSGTTLERGDISLGLEATRALQAGERPVQIQAGLALQQGIGDAQVEQEAFFLTGSDRFVVQGARLDALRVAASLGASTQLRRNLSLWAGWRGQFGSHEQAHDLLVNLAMRW